MAFYGYDPSRYRKDFSWIGDVGKVLAQTAHQVPELIEFNKRVHENKHANSQSYGETIDLINGLNEQEALDFAQAWGLRVDDPQEAKKQMIAQLPEPSYREKNEKYHNKLVTQTYQPLIQSLYARGYDNDAILRVASRASKFGAVSDDQWGKLVQRDRMKKARQEFQKILEENPEANPNQILSEVARKYDLKYTVAQEFLDADLAERQRQLDVEGVDEMSIQPSQVDAVRTGLKGGVSEGTRKEVVGAIHRDTPKPFNPQSTEDQILQFNRRLSQIAEEKLEAEDTDRMRELKREENLLKEKVRTAEALLEKNPATETEANQSRPSIVRGIRAGDEAEFFEDWVASQKGGEKGPYEKGWWLWRGPDREAFTQAYFDRYGVEPRFDEGGSLIPQFGAKVRVFQQRYTDQQVEKARSALQTDSGATPEQKRKARHILDSMGIDY